MGADLAFNCFDVELDWIHFNGHANFKEHTQHGHYKIKYDTIDLTFGRSFSVTRCFYVKPFIGLRGAYINQKLKSHLETLFTSVIGNNTVTTDLDDKERFRGMVPNLALLPIGT